MGVRTREMHSGWSEESGDLNHQLIQAHRTTCQNRGVAFVQLVAQADAQRATVDMHMKVLRRASECGEGGFVVVRACCLRDGVLQI
ncbi:hypothetical protein SAY86_023222 [Trapa natans]|uniref:Uncharacterized protein n=1 Tax=Trapa natans TaxID=22666 RepID=A0AAN7M6M0_TRANT|nr:hypothetical protein SAY86_023222 [Trapa natans]